MAPYSSRPAAGPYHHRLDLMREALLALESFIRAQEEVMEQEDTV